MKATEIVEIVAQRQYARHWREGWPRWEHADVAARLLYRASAEDALRAEIARRAAARGTDARTSEVRQ